MNKFNGCQCRGFEEAYKKYKNLRKQSNWLKVFDTLGFEEAKVILILIDSIIEKKCQFCGDQGKEIDSLMQGWAEKLAFLKR